MSTPKTQTENNARKIAATVATITLGHALSVWAITQIKVPELAPIEPTKPIEVKIINLPKEAPPPPPPPKPKPKPEPKKPEPKKEPPKEVKIVEKPKPIPPKPITPPKVIATKTEAPKPQPVVTPPPVVTPKPQPIPPAPTPVPVVKPEPKPVPPTPAPVVKHEPKPEPPAPPVVKHEPPKQLSAGELAWRNKPNPNATQLGNYFKKDSPDRVVVKIKLVSDASGKIISANVVKSSGIPALDSYIAGRVKAARLSPYPPSGATSVIDIAVNKPDALKSKAPKAPKNEVAPKAEDPKAEDPKTE